MVSKFFFADDTIIFRRAKSIELSRVNQILEICKEASGHAIN